MEKSILNKMMNINTPNKKRIDLFAFPEKVSVENEVLLDQWDLNIFEKNEFQKHLLIWTMFKKLDLFKTYDIDEEKFQNLLGKTHQLYS